MKITYIYHSCYCVELEHHILLFDYYKGTLPKFDQTKNLYVFASHAHEDHFSSKIFSLPVKPTAFILSNDIPHTLHPQVYEVKAHESWKVDDMVVETLASTDQGVAFLVQVEGQCIYHAGDLNWWDWGEEDTPLESKTMASAYQKEITRLSKHLIDVALVPLDPRLQANYYKGLDYFMRHTQTKVVFPMHMWDDYKIVSALKQQDCSIPYRHCIQEVKQPNQTFTI